MREKSSYHLLRRGNKVGRDPKTAGNSCRPLTMAVVGDGGGKGKIPRGKNDEKT